MDYKSNTSDLHTGDDGVTTNAGQHREGRHLTGICNIHSPKNNVLPSLLPRRAIQSTLRNRLATVTCPTNIQLIRAVTIVRRRMAIDIKIISPGIEIRPGDGDVAAI